MTKQVDTPVIVLFAVFMPGPVFAEVVDQEWTRPASGRNTIYYFYGLGQSFTPAYAAQTGVELWIDDVNTGQPLLPVTLNIRQDGIDGPVLADTAFLPSAGSDGWIHVPLSYSVAQGQTYFIQLETQTKRWAIAVSGVNDPGYAPGYAGGMFYINGQPTESTDMLFRTWALPEPMSVSLLTLGGLAVMRRRS